MSIALIRNVVLEDMERLDKLAKEKELNPDLTYEIRQMSEPIVALCYPPKKVNSHFPNRGRRSNVHHG